MTPAAGADRPPAAVADDSPAIEADHLYRFFHAGDDEALALQGVSLRVDGGEIVAVTGPSGSGKSTLLGCLAGLDEPDGGMVRIAGERLSRRSEEERARIRGERIGTLYQQSNLVGHLSVADNVALVQLLSRKPRAARRRAEVLERCAIAHRAGARPAQLSGGELARAAMAVAIANEPVVLLADEPTGELDRVTAERILELLRELAAQGVAVIVVTHSPDVAAATDRELRLRDGRVVA